jgi:hypothetical protein
VEELQEFSNIRTPSPYWIHAPRVLVPLVCCEAAAKAIITALGGEDSAKKTLGGIKWWQVSIVYYLHSLFNPLHDRSEDLEVWTVNGLPSARTGKKRNVKGRSKKPSNDKLLLLRKGRAPLRKVQRNQQRRIQNRTTQLRWMK